MAAPNGFFVVATSDGEPVACGGVQRLADGSAEIKRMWVHDGWRGAGLGARLLRHLEDLACTRGHAVVRLDTNDTLTEAIAMYERAGYRAIERYNDNPWARCWFEKDL
jgi:GNAT superfamily N-acetyltransferase